MVDFRKDAKPFENFYINDKSQLLKMETVTNKMYTIFVTKLYWLPVLFYFVFPCMYVILYIVYTMIGYLPAKFPYLSQTTCSWFLNMLIGTSILLGAGVLYMRCDQVQKITMLLPDSASLDTVNKCATVLATCAITILLITITLEKLKLNTPLLDYIGNICFFGFGTVYLLLQQNISEQCCCWKLHARSVCVRPRPRRCLLNVSAIALLFILLTASILFHSYGDIKFDVFANMDDVHKFYITLVLVLSEYVSIATFTLYMLSYQRDFRMFSYLYYLKDNILWSRETVQNFEQISDTVSQSNSLDSKMLTFWNNKAFKYVT